MTSLYENLRRPWASWPMDMKNHDPTNYLVRDASGNGRHLTIGDGAGGGAPRKLTGRSGYSGGRYNGGYLTRANETWASSVITMEIMLDVQAPDLGYMFSFEDPSQVDGTVVGIFFVYKTGMYLRFATNATNIAQAATWTLNPVIPVTHLVGRYDGSNTDLFVNGKLIEQAPTPLPVYNGNGLEISLFSRSLVGTDIRQSNIYSAAIWDVALTNIEIQELSNRAHRKLAQI